MPLLTPLIAATVAALAVVPIGSAPTAEPAVTRPATYYVACGASGSAGEGTLSDPFTTLDQVNAVTLNPGDRVSFVTDTTCSGTFAPKGEGTDQAWITIGSYKPRGAKGNLPVIDAAGASNAVLISNMQYVDISGLKLTNSVKATAKEAHNGLQLNLHNFGIGRGYRIHGLKIEDINGSDLKAINGSAAILVNVTGDGEAAGETPTAYDDLQIRNNQIKNVDREGIYFKSIWSKRDEVGSQDYTGAGPWTPSTHVVVADNQLTSIGGDGMKIDATQSAVVERNTIKGFQLRSTEANAGLWTFNADDTIVQNNDVSGGGNSRDGMSFDADGGAQRTVFQYNYSHDNAGGLLLLCPYSGAWTHGTTVRYNLSVNDQTRLFQVCAGDVDGTKIYNNTIVNDTASPNLFYQDDKSVSSDIEFANNLVLDTAGSMGFTLPKTPQLSFYNNAFTGVNGVPKNADGTVNPGGMSADGIGLTRPAKHPADYGEFGGYRLRAGSPGIGAGKAIDDPGTKDLWGNPIPATPSIGAYQGAGVQSGDLAATIAFAKTPTLPIGAAGTVRTTLTWWGAKPLTEASNVTATMGVPKGWQAKLEGDIPTLRQGQSATLAWSVTSKAKAKAGSYPVTVSVAANSQTLASAKGTVTIGTILPSVQAGFDTVAITADADPGAGELAASHSSLSAEALKAAKGIAPGASVEGEDATYTWPTFTPGKADGMWVNGQLLSVNATGENLSFALFGINGSPSGTATIVYSDGTTTDFTLAAGDFYYNTPAAGNTKLAVMNYRNIPAGRDSREVTVFETTVAIDPAKTVDYVQLPTLSAKSESAKGMILLADSVGGQVTPPTPPTPDSGGTTPATPGGSGASGSAGGTSSAQPLANTGMNAPVLGIAVGAALLAIAAGLWLLRRRRMAS